MTDAEKLLLRSYLADASEPYAISADILDSLIDRASGDFNDALAEGWEWKAANVASWYEASIEGRVLNRAQVFTHCIKMAELYRTRATGVESVLITVTPTTAPESEFG